MNFQKDIRIFLVGMAMGVANIIPGVSGGTIAVVFGIYEELMEALGNFISNKEKRWQYIRFLAILFLGSLIAVVGLASVLAWCFENYPLMTVYFFMGLILGSIPVVIKSHDEMKLNRNRLISLVLGIAVVVWLAVLQSAADSEGSKLIHFEGYSLLDYGYFLICGAVASSAMIVPGVSGSFILILLGAYWTVLGALSGLFNQLFSSGLTDEVVARFMILGSLAIGVVAGILGFSRIMSWALKNYPAVTMYAILGLIIGSFYQIYPGFEFSFNGLGAIVTMIIGLVISLKFAKYD